MSNYVFVVDANRKPLEPCKPGVARSLLKSGKAAVLRMYPFTIILKKKVEGDVKTMTLKIDPGSKTTGIALVSNKKEVIFGAELEHRGSLISKRLEERRLIRRNRRSRKTRYRKNKFLNRIKHKPKGWLPPSLIHCVLTTITWVNRFRKFCNVQAIAVERVKFDMQKMQNPEISGVEYQQGELQGYEVREYLLEKWGRKCAYCQKEGIPLQIEHIQPKSKGGTNRVSNLTLACEKCNTKKGSKDIKEFLKNKPELLSKILSQTKQPLKDAAAINATRNKLYEELLKTGLPIETGTGAQTKYNRTKLGLPKQHWIDAACIGEYINLNLCTVKVLNIKAMGHGRRKLCSTDKYGIPNKHRLTKNNFGINTGDIAKDKIGNFIGRVTIRNQGTFDLAISTGKRVCINYKNCLIIHRKDGYVYKYK